MRSEITMDDVRKAMEKILNAPIEHKPLVVRESQLARAKAKGEFIPPHILVVPDTLKVD